MAITKYEKNGKTFWRVYVDFRSKKDPKVRVQKRLNNLGTEREARIEEKRLILTLSEQLSKCESQGLSWARVIERWVRQQELYPTKRLAPTTIVDYEAVLRNWTKPWLSRTAS